MTSQPLDQARKANYVALPVGQTVGRYEIVSILGQGGFGITYRARDTRLNREVALKEYLPMALAVRQGGTTVLPSSTEAAEDFNWGRDRFITEGQTLASLHHAPAIVRVFDFLEANGTAYIVMELLSGVTLEDRLNNGKPLSPAEVDKILWPILDGLEQVHGAGFLHRDIKPANILLDAAGKPTLIDFGASRAAMASRTTAMTAIFTPGYAAAEQFSLGKQGPWTDVYGFAATLYRAIAGKAPPGAFDRMVDDEYEPLGKLQPVGFARGLLAGIDAGMGVRATERPQSIAGWRTILTQTLGGDGVTIVSRPAPHSGTAPTFAPAAAPPAAESPPKGPTRSAVPQRKTAMWIGAIATVLLAICGGAYLTLVQSRTGTAPVVVDAESERARIEQDVQRARGALATAEQAATRQAEEDARREVEAEAKRKAEQAAADMARAQEEARLKAAAVTDRQRMEAEATSKKMDADAQSRRQAEETETKRKAEADAAERARAQDEVQKQRDALAAAETARRQAEEENVRLKAEADTRQKADVEAAAKRQAEDEARQKAEAASMADADAKRKAEDRDRKGAEAAETAVRLAPVDRQHVQVALTALGFNTNGTDGVLGPHSRAMIAAWQKARNQPETGFLTGAQNQALMKETAPAISKYDDDQKRLEEDKKKADEARRKADEDAKALAAVTPPATIATPRSASRADDGTLSGGNANGHAPSPFIGEWHYIDSQRRSVTIIIDRVDGQFAYGQMKVPMPYKNQTLGRIYNNSSSEARITGDKLQIRGPGFTTDLTLEGGALVGSIALGAGQPAQWTFKKVR